MTEVTEVIPYAIENPVPMNRWGKDHWSTLAYVETRIVDHEGQLAEPHMRSDGGRYATRLKPTEEAIEEARIRQTAGERFPTPRVEELFGHNDWDCLADMYAAGLIVVEGLVSPKLHNGRLLHRLTFQKKAWFSLTEEGYRIAAQLREHKARGRGYHTFRPTSG